MKKKKPKPKPKRTKARPANNAVAKPSGGAAWFFDRMTTRLPGLSPNTPPELEARIHAAFAKLLNVRGPAPEDPELSIRYTEEHIRNTRHLAALLEQAPDYLCVDSSVSVGGLKGHADDLEAANEEFRRIAAELAASRAEQDKALYDPETGLYAVARRIKEQVRITFGEDSEEYRKVSAIEIEPPEGDGVD